MRQIHSKSKSAKQTSKKRTPTIEQLKKNASFLYNVMHDEGEDSARLTLAEHIEDVMGHDVLRSRDVFVRAYVDGYATSDKHSKRNAGEILRRLRKGETPAGILVSWERKAAKRADEHRQRAEAIINSPDAYDEETRKAVRYALEQGATNLPELVAQAESGAEIWDFTTPEYKEKVNAILHEQSHSSLAEMLSAVLKHPKLPHELHESIFEALVDLQNEAGAREITESLQGIRATLEIYEQRDGGDDTTDLQPRNKREQAIVDDVLEHAEEIRAARASCDSRASAIGKGGRG
jgi:hypothetical protein